MNKTFKKILLIIYFIIYSIYYFKNLLMGNKTFWVFKQNLSRKKDEFLSI